MEAERIRALRQRLKLTMAQLGERLGVPQATVIQWELGERFPTKAHVRKLEALEVEKGAQAAGNPAGAREAVAHGALYAPFLCSAEFAALLRKLLFHPELRARALDLAASFRDPAAPP